MHSVTDLIDTTEMYLKTIFELEEEGITPLRARIAERLGHSGPTVSQTVARMERDGLIHLADDRQLQFTERGRTLATRVMRKHRLAERLLVDVIGLEWEFVHDEACRWEHVMSERVERKILALLADHHNSPYGNPIPGLDELGEEPGEDFRAGVSHAARAGRRRAAVGPSCAGSARPSRSTTRLSRCSPSPGCCRASRWPSDATTTGSSRSATAPTRLTGCRCRRASRPTSSPPPSDRRPPRAPDGDVPRTENVPDVSWPFRDLGVTFQSPLL